MKGVSSFAAVAGICVLFLYVAPSEACDEECSFELIKDEVVKILAKNHPGMLEVPVVKGTKKVFGIPITYAMQNGALADLRGFKKNSNVLVRRGARMSQIKLQMTVQNTRARFTHARGTVFGISVDVNNPKATVGVITLSLAIRLDESAGGCRVKFNQVKTHVQDLKLQTKPPLPQLVVDQVNSLVDEVLGETISEVLNANSNQSCDPFKSILANMTH
ncbi:hypothetical protein TKK_0007484 [Trichogramma kaykai]|uniref:Uncharacterized protein n=1 Tax=Trichogramma kaykai TaxID=54128 RepID=A0ABD2WGI6_9HYME